MGVEDWGSSAVGEAEEGISGSCVVAAVGREDVAAAGVEGTAGAEGVDREGAIVGTVVVPAAACAGLLGAAAAVVAFSFSCAVGGAVAAAIVAVVGATAVAGFKIGAGAFVSTWRLAGAGEVKGAAAGGVAVC